MYIVFFRIISQAVFMALRSALYHPQISTTVEMRHFCFIALANFERSFCRNDESQSQSNTKWCWDIWLSYYFSWFWFIYVEDSCSLLIFKTFLFLSVTVFHAHICLFFDIPQYFSQLPFVQKYLMYISFWNEIFWGIHFWNLQITKICL